MAQGGDEAPGPGEAGGPGLPAAEGGVIDRTRPAPGRSGRPGHAGPEGCFVCADLRFVNECQPYRHVTHERPTPAARCRTGRRRTGPLLPGGAQVFAGCQAKAAQMRQTGVRRASMSCTPPGSTTGPSGVGSRFSLIRRRIRSATSASLPCPPVCHARQHCPAAWPRGTRWRASTAPCRSRTRPKPGPAPPPPGACGLPRQDQRPADKAPQQAACLSVTPVNHPRQSPQTSATDSGNH